MVMDPRTLQQKITLQKQKKEKKAKREYQTKVKECANSYLNEMLTRADIPCRILTSGDNTIVEHALALLTSNGYIINIERNPKLQGTYSNLWIFEIDMAVTVTKPNFSSNPQNPPSYIEATTNIQSQKNCCFLM
jgi:hypothetical protein